VRTSTQIYSDKTNRETELNRNRKERTKQSKKGKNRRGRRDDVGDRRGEEERWRRKEEEG
jgi:hypothetical protein